MKIIAGKHARRKLHAPGQKTRPTSGKLRETLFNICQGAIEGTTFLDLFAGSGAIGLEALSRGAAHVTFVESDPLAIQAIRKNILALDEKGRSTLLPMDVFRALESLKGSTFDIVFADPPYGKGLSDRVLGFVDQEGLLAPGGVLFLEDETEAKSVSLERLALKKSRRVGRAFLQEYS